jgi:hypothetical protein
MMFSAESSNGGSEKDINARYRFNNRRLEMGDGSGAARDGCKAFRKSVRKEHIKDAAEESEAVVIPFYGISLLDFRPFFSLMLL